MEWLELSSKNSAMHCSIVLNCILTNELPWRTARSSFIGNTSERRFWSRWVCRILVGTFHTQAGRFWHEALRTEVLFVTLDKSGKTFSPSTRYEDFALSPTRFHWQSQSTTGDSSPTGRAIFAPGSRTVLGFCFSCGRRRAIVRIPRAFAICFAFGKPTDEHLLGSGVSDTRLVLRGMRHAPGGLKP